MDEMSNPFEDNGIDSTPAGMIFMLKTFKSGGFAIEGHHFVGADDRIEVYKRLKEMGLEPFPGKFLGGTASMVSDGGAKQKSFMRKPPKPERCPQCGKKRPRWAWDKDDRGWFCAERIDDDGDYCGFQTFSDDK